MFNTKLLVVASLVAGCTGTYYPFGTVSIPAPAATVTVEAAAEPAAAPPPVVVSAPAPPPVTMTVAMPVAPAVDPRCAVGDPPLLCSALITLDELGAVLRDARPLSCHANAAALNRYADNHGDALAALRDAQEAPLREIRRFQARHQGEIDATLTVALEVNSRCRDSRRLAEAFDRVGFSGFVRSRFSAR